MLFLTHIHGEQGQNLSVGLCMHLVFFPRVGSCAGACRGGQAQSLAVCGRCQGRGSGSSHVGRAAFC